jgi:hypothetical protein
MVGKRILLKMLLDQRCRLDICRSAGRPFMRACAWPPSRRLRRIAASINHNERAADRSKRVQ